MEYLKISAILSETETYFEANVQYIIFFKMCVYREQAENVPKYEKHFLSDRISKSFYCISLFSVIQVYFTFIITNKQDFYNEFILSSLLIIHVFTVKGKG